MPDLFKQIMPSIMQDTVDVLQTPEDEGSYPVFLVNRALSYHLDCILIASQTNVLPGIDRRLHYDYVRTAVRKGKRSFQKWARKDETSAYIDAVKKFYDLSDAKAAVVVRVLTAKELNDIMAQVDPGGRDNE